MKHAVGRVLANPAVRGAIMVAIADITQIYAKAFVNVVRRKLDQFIDGEEKSEPQIVEVIVED